MIQKVILGDCLEVMRDISDKSIDMILCDLPYGRTACEWDVVIPFDKLWREYNRICKENAAIVLFGSQPFTTDLINSNRNSFKYSLVWNKNVPTGMSAAKYRPMKYHEDILVFYKEHPIYNPVMKSRVGKKKECYKYDHYCGESNHVKYAKIKKRYDPDFVQPSTVLDFKVVPNRNGKLHPTQKPIEICEYLIKTYTNEGNLVLDSCVGSGSTLVAAQNLNRQFIGIEKEQKYYEICLQRLKESIDKPEEK
ncbi:MAG: site-specific DNA-methyltransferase [Nanoarchaeota archaeon]